MKQLSFRSRRRDAALWFALLGAPIAWLFQFQANYTLVPWACSFSILWVIPVIETGAVVISAAAAIVAWRFLRRPLPRDAAEPTDELERRSRFMAILAFSSSVLFVLVTIAQALALLFIDPCAR